MTTDLVIREPLEIKKLFSEGGMNGLLQDIETQVKAHVPDISTDQGRKDIISLAYNVSRSKTLIVKTGEAAIEDEKKELKRKTGILKTAKDFLDNLRDETRMPVTEWEAEQELIRKKEEEAERKKVEARVEQFAEVGCTMSFLNVASLDDEEFDSLLAEKTAEFEEKKKKEAIEAAEKKAEAERLALQKKEQDAKEAELKKQADELAAQQKAIQDEKDRIAREEQAKIDAENARIEAEAKAKAKAQEEARKAEERRLRDEAETKRQEALKTDKQKLTEWIDKFKVPSSPDLKNEESVNLFENISMDMEAFLQVQYKRVKDL